MKWRRYIVFMCIFSISLLGASLLNRWQTEKIRDIINQAGKNGHPIFVVSAIIGLDPCKAVTSTDSDMVPLSFYSQFYLESTGFYPDGTFFIEQDIFNSEKAFTNYFVFPKRHPVRRLKTISTGPKNSSLFSSLIGSGKSSGRFEINFQNLDEIYIFDKVTLENTRFDVGSDPPWSLEEANPDEKWGLWVSSDNRVIFGAGFNQVNPGPVEVWRFDIAAMDWSSIGVHEVFEGIECTAGPNGDIIAYYKSNPALSGTSTPYTATIPLTPGGMDLVFIDGHTGDELKTVRSGGYPQIGKKWVSCVDYSGMGSYPYGLTITLFDLQNGWARQTLKIPIFLQVCDMYEPPPNGLAGMYENYVEE